MKAQKTFSALPAALLLACSGASGQVATTNSPSLLCEELKYDFGLLASTGHMEHSFILKNGGSAPLDISQVKTACGCTAAKLGTNSLAPGTQTALAVSMNLQGRSGHQRKSIYVHSNDPVMQICQLNIVGEALATSAGWAWGLGYLPGDAAPNLAGLFDLSALNRALGALRKPSVTAPGAAAPAH